MHTFLLGYNLESSEWSRPGVASAFLRAVTALHRELAMPCTIFVRGQAMEDHADEFRRARDEGGEMLDFQQATYSGLPLKTVCREDHRGVTVFQGGTLQQIRDDVARASDVFERVMGRRPTGLSGPLGYYRGLSDRPDVLEILHRLGIRFLRTYTRNAADSSPLAFEVQPFRYAPQGFEDMLEIPGQGWPDGSLREAGEGDVTRYIRQVRKDLDYVAAKGLTWSCTQHDAASMQEDPEMRSTRAILQYARQLEFTVRTHGAFYERMRTEN